MGDAKAYVENTTTEHGARIAEEAKQRADAKEAFKDEYKTYSMEMSRDDLTRLTTMIGRSPNVGKFRELVEFMNGDKGFWTEELTLKIVDHDTDYSDYVNPHESKSEKIAELEAQLKELKR